MYADAITTTRHRRYHEYNIPMFAFLFRYFFAFLPLALLDRGGGAAAAALLLGLAITRCRAFTAADAAYAHAPRNLFKGAKGELRSGPSTPHRNNIIIYVYIMRTT